MTPAEFDRLRDQLKADYERARFEIEDYDTIPDLEDLPQGVAARVRDVAHLFFDIRGFTTWADTKRDATVFKVLDPTFRLLFRIARYYSGFIEKTIGDGLHVLLGAEESKPEVVALIALQCAQDMGIAMDEIVSPFMETHRHIEEPFEWGIGVEMGHTLIAKMGIRNHFYYTSISKAANYAAKFQEDAEPGEILVGECLYEHLPEEIQDDLRYRGRIGDREVYTFKPRRDEEGNWRNILWIGLSALGLLVGRKIYGALRKNQALGVTPQGTLTEQGGTPIKPHRWYGQEQ